MTDDLPSPAGHRKRLKQHAKDIGFEKLRPREMIELFLFQTIPVRDVSGLSRVLLDRFGSVYGVLHASKAELTGVKGIGEITARWLMNIGAVSDAYLDAVSKPHFHVESLNDALMIAKPLLTLWQAPCCGLLMLDFENRLSFRWKLCDHTQWADKALLRQALVRSLGADAFRVIVILYKDQPVLTDYDRSGIAQLTRMLANVTIQLTDCICIAQDGYRSYALEEVMKEK